MKHVNAPKSRIIWASIITNLFVHLIVIDTRKHGVRFENSLGPFALHDISRSNFVVLNETRHVYFLILLIGGW
jgi:hypothetical protein